MRAKYIGPIPTTLTESISLHFAVCSSTRQQLLVNKQHTHSFGVHQRQGVGRLEFAQRLDRLGHFYVRQCLRVFDTTQLSKNIYLNDTRTCGIKHGAIALSHARTSCGMEQECLTTVLYSRGCCSPCCLWTERPCPTTPCPVCRSRAEGASAPTGASRVHANSLQI